MSKPKGKLHSYTSICPKGFGHAEQLPHTENITRFTKHLLVGLSGNLYAGTTALSTDVLACKD